MTIRTNPFHAEVTSDDLFEARRMQPPLSEVYARAMARRLELAAERDFWAEWERREREEYAANAIRVFRSFLVDCWCARLMHEVQRGDGRGGLGIGPPAPGAGHGWGAADELAERWSAL